MNWMKRNWVPICVGVLIGIVSGVLVHAQTTAGLPAQATFGGVHTACTLSPGPAVPPALPQASLCEAGDGLWLSVNGGAYVQLGAAGAAGVTSFNGRTGAVVPVASDYPDAVTSVNGKTGAVVLTVQ